MCLTLMRPWHLCCAAQETSGLRRARVLESAPGASHPPRLGATVTIVSAGHLAEKTVELAFTGPDTVKKGIEFSLLDSPLINKIEWVDFDV